MVTMVIMRGCTIEKWGLMSEHYGVIGWCRPAAGESGLKAAQSLEQPSLRPGAKMN
jgi:hypothetical protein